MFLIIFSTFLGRLNSADRVDFKFHITFTKLNLPTTQAHCLTWCDGLMCVGSQAHMSNNAQHITCMYCIQGIICHYDPFIRIVGHKRESGKLIPFSKYWFSK